MNCKNHFYFKSHSNKNEPATHRMLSREIMNLRISSLVNRLNWWQWCWWHRYIGDFMMVTDFRCWWQNHYVSDFSVMLVIFSICHQHPESATKFSNLSSTHLVSNIRHQRQCNRCNLGTRFYFVLWIEYSSWLKWIFE